MIFPIFIEIIAFSSAWLTRELIVRLKEKIRVTIWYQ